MADQQILLIGYGNPGRCDDGLGPALADRLEARKLPGLRVFTDYQLCVEHAMMLAEVDCVVFADAMLQGPEQFSFHEIRPESSESLTSHALLPQSVLTLCDSLFHKQPRAFVLGILGHEFGEVKEGLSARARLGLDAAEAFFLQWYAGQS